MAGNFNIKDQLDFKFNVNGKEVSGEEGAKHAQEFLSKMSSEMGDLLKKLGKDVTSNVANKGVNAIKDKVIPTNINIDSVKDMLNQEKLNEWKEKLPVIDASTDDGNFQINVNGKSLFTLNLSNFIKK
ncbi:hypothetical protein [Niallia sp. NCCP-28]|uniref:hypothetical protein n=1 Tax=Niallia sp. NCCP-28 TaxID=2934712 RepID=UPI0020862EDD|nr:hypothetical protein [Niallia sp. NCCP-28]GKU82559.1 hypothetical protein NCCP28_19550 [Niallia sp. NCCP-28]